VSWIRIRISNTDPDPGEPFQYGSAWIQIQNTDFNRFKFCSCSSVLSISKRRNVRKNGRICSLIQILISHKIGTLSGDKPNQAKGENSKFVCTVTVCNSGRRRSLRRQREGICWHSCTRCSSEISVGDPNDFIRIRMRFISPIRNRI